MATETQLRIGLATNAIVDEINVEPTISGGGTGWTATAGEFTAKGKSKAGAAEALVAVVLGRVRPVRVKKQRAPSLRDRGLCNAECMGSVRLICECSCGGQNHGGGNARTWAVTVVGEKECLCGCGQTTERRFVPGHDARFHAHERLLAGAAEAGLDPAAYKVQMIEARKERARLARARRKAEKIAQGAFEADGWLNFPEM